MSVQVQSGLMGLGSSALGFAALPASDSAVLRRMRNPQIRSAVHSGKQWRSLHSAPQSARHEQARSPAKSSALTLPSFGLFFGRHVALCCVTVGAMRLSRRRSRRCRGQWIKVSAVANGGTVRTTQNVVEVQEQLKQVVTGDDDQTADTLRVRRVKDMILIKEMRLALTSGEFALRLSGAERPGLVDYEGLCGRLNSFVDKLEREPPDTEVMSKEEVFKALASLHETRVRLEEKLMETRTIKLAPPVNKTGHEKAPAEASSSSTASSSSHGVGDDGVRASTPKANGVNGASAPATAAPTGANGTPMLGGNPAQQATHKVASVFQRKLPRAERILIYLREDDTVDIEAAIKESSAVLPLSRDLSERLRGKQSNSGEMWPEESPEEPALNAARVRDKKEVLINARRELAAAERDSDRLSKQAEGALRDREKHEALIKEVLQQRHLVERFRVSKLLASIDLLLERIGASLQRELEKTNLNEWDLAGHPLKMLVVEFSLLDKQVAPYHRLLRGGAELCNASLCVGLDYSELRVLEANVVRFADRVGASVEGIVEESNFFKSLQRRASAVRKGWQKLRQGLSFYGNGSRIIAKDIQHAVKLLLKAACLKQPFGSREAQVCFRAVKDITVLVPFLIILLIPLSPPGHVFVFSLIMKIFPDFFPSPFTERRQNVMKVYDDIKPAALRPKAPRSPFEPYA